MRAAPFIALVELDDPGQHALDFRQVHEGLKIVAVGLHPDQPTQGIGIQRRHVVPVGPVDHGVEGLR